MCMLLEEHCQDFPNKIQKQRAQFFNNFIKNKMANTRDINR